MSNYYITTICKDIKNDLYIYNNFKNNILNDSI